MSAWADIETGVVSGLAGLIDGDTPLLATVAGRNPMERKALVTMLLGERLPAAYVVVDGREASARSSGRSGRVTVRVILAARSLRAEIEGRTNGAEGLGVFALSEAASGVLEGLDLAPLGQLKLIGEAALPAQDQVTLWEQSYIVHCPAEGDGPAFGGVVLTGAFGTVRVELGELRMASSSFAFPGIDGEFERRLGARERLIWWRGELRGSGTELNSLEAGIELEVRGGQAKVMTDGYGRQFGECVLRAFKRVGARGRDARTGEYVQDFEMEFAQLQG